MFYALRNLVYCIVIYVCVCVDVIKQNFDAKFAIKVNIDSILNNNIEIYDYVAEGGLGEGFGKFDSK